MTFGFMVLVDVNAADAFLRLFAYKMTAAQETTIDSRSLVTRMWRRI